ncbi:MAG: helix-turn-helix domain-containing protein [Patescibacteria group bacterium]|nr:helix-turn-helix domain-containing protein [Patescibacteria group bacterium]
MTHTYSEPQDDEERYSNMATDPILAGRQLREMREKALITPDLRGFIRDNRDYGLTLEEVAALSKGELSKATISKMERGEVTSPSLKSIVVLAQIYHLSPNDLAQIFGFWEPVVRQVEDDKRFQDFVRTVNFYLTRNDSKAELLLNGLSGLMKMVENFPS